MFFAVSKKQIRSKSNELYRNNKLRCSVFRYASWFVGRWVFFLPVQQTCFKWYILWLNLASPHYNRHINIECFVLLKLRQKFSKFFGLSSFFDLFVTFFTLCPKQGLLNTGFNSSIAVRFSMNRDFYNQCKC